MSNRLSQIAAEVAGWIVVAEQPGREIKHYRSSLGITQQEMAQLLGVRRETLSRIENGSITPSFNFLRNFSRKVAAIKLIRELIAKTEASLSEPLTPWKLRLYLGLEGEEVEKLLKVGKNSYIRHKNKILKVIK